MIPLDRIRTGLRFFAPNGGRGGKLPPQWEVLRGPERHINYGIQTDGMVQVVNLRSGVKNWLSIKFIHQSSFIEGIAGTWHGVLQYQTSVNDQVDHGQ